MSKKKSKKYITIKEAAKLLDISPRSVNRYIKAKRLEAVKIGDWRITKQNLRAFIKSSSNL